MGGLNPPHKYSDRPLHLAVTPNQEVQNLVTHSVHGGRPLTNEIAPNVADPPLSGAEDTSGTLVSTPPFFIYPSQTIHQDLNMQVKGCSIGQELNKDTGRISHAEYRSFDTQTSQRIAPNVADRPLGGADSHTGNTAPFSFINDLNLRKQSTGFALHTQDPGVLKPRGQNAKKPYYSRSPRSNMCSGWSDDT